MKSNAFKYTGSNDKELLEHLKKLVAFGDVELRFRMWNESRAKTEAQNDTFHELLEIFYKSGCASFDDYESLRNHYKRIAGIRQWFRYRDGSMVVNVDTMEEVPKEKRGIAIRDYDSWSTATFGQGKNAISILIADMKNAGVDSDKFFKILEHFENKTASYYDKGF